MLSPRRLAVLREFAGRGTIAAAAEALAFTPSAVSQQLAQLQREAGVELFRKVGRRLELTDAGRTLAARADELLARVEEIETELAAQAGDVRGTVRVAAFQTAAMVLVVPALDGLAAAHPRLRVELAEVEAEESLPLLARGGLDVAIAEEYEHAPRPRLPRLRARVPRARRAAARAPARASGRRGRRAGRARLAARRPVGHRPDRHRLRRHGRRHLPGRRRLRARRPPPRQRPGPAAGARRHGPGRRARAGAGPARARRARGDPADRGGPLQPRAVRRRAGERPRAPGHRRRRGRRSGARRPR